MLRPLLFLGSRRFVDGGGREDFPKELLGGDAEGFGEAFEHGELEVFAPGLDGLVVFVIAADEGGCLFLRQAVPMPKFPHLGG